MSTLKIVPQGLRMASQPARTRVTRQPKHTFHLENMPYQLQPFLIAPVLPGETLTNLYLQARVVTDPVKNRLIGGWTEHNFFFVPLRLLLDESTRKDLLMDMTYDPAPLYGTAKAKFYQAAGEINWVERAFNLVVDHYYRDEGRTHAQNLISGMPAAALVTDSWLDSVYQASALPDFDMPAEESSYREFESLRQTYEFMTHNAMTKKTWEEYLQDFGVRTSDSEDKTKPELLREMRNWTYPSNTIADDGSASSALSWSVADAADKRRFFDEPGFIIGITSTRLKVYLNKQTSAGVSLLDNALSWLPAVMKEQVETSIRLVEKAKGPLSSVHTSEDYVVDVRDLFVYGDQFVNHTGAAKSGGIDLPVAAHDDMRFPTEAMVKSLFVGDTPTALVEQDGQVSLSILGTQLDHT